LAVKNKKLEEIDRIKTSFFTDISHEIRTPLSLIIDPLEKISRELVTDEKLQHVIDIMRRNGQRLMRLVNQLLDISKLDAGRMKIILSEQDIIKSLRILVYEFLSLAESKQIKYIVEIPDEKITVWFDRDKTEKIISNLLSNAFKFTPSGGQVNCIIKIINKKGQLPKQYLEVKVIDTGKGIKKEELSKIFDRFYRIEERIETDVPGTGIGLSLVNEFVQILHGEIKVNSTPGVGSEFIVTLPLGRDHLQPDEYILSESSPAVVKSEISGASQDKHQQKPEIVTGEHRLRILVIEDNADLRDYLKESLSDEYDIVTSGNGREGINTAYTMIPDIIITDIMMPDIDGIQVCYQIKNDERTSHIPVLMLTAKTTWDDKLKGLKSGADGYIFKPFNMEELRLQISNILTLRENIIRRYSNIRSFITGEAEIKTVDDIFMDKLIKLINKHISDFDFDVAHLREAFGMSRMHLFRKIKALTGQAPVNLIRNIRLEKSVDLLQQHKGNITEIANSVCFSNPSYFARTFKNYFGVAPKDYSKDHGLKIRGNS
ncbi:MAG: response regulator, partial [Bacteroidales bacterium]|nr:response regulator [Bacteroidales bacterium]